METYVADLEREISKAQDCASFLERVSDLDMRYLDNWFVQRFGAANVDPMQAFRQQLSCGVVRLPAGTQGVSAAGPSTAFGARAAELYHRHSDLLESSRRSSPQRPTSCSPMTTSGSTSSLWPQQQACGWPVREGLDRAQASTCPIAAPVVPHVVAAPFAQRAQPGLLWEPWPASGGGARREAERSSIPNMATWCMGNVASTDQGICSSQGPGWQTPPRSKADGAPVAPAMPAPAAPVSQPGSLPPRWPSLGGEMGARLPRPPHMEVPSACAMDALWRFGPGAN